MKLPGWIEGFPGAVTICDTEGIILYMNDAAAVNFAKDGGQALVGQNLLDCHPEPSRTMLADMLATEQAHVYTIEKKGNQKLIYQTPWYEDGEYRGFMELGLPLPADMPHFVRG